VPNEIVSDFRHNSKNVSGSGYVLRRSLLVADLMADPLVLDESVSDSWRSLKKVYTSGHRSLSYFR
jgi:hypothetical protein